MAELDLKILMTENTARTTIEGKESGARQSRRGVRRMLAAFTYRDFRIQWIGACSSAIGNVDANHRAKLAGALADQFAVLPRPRRVPATASDHPVHTHRRGVRRSLRPAQDAAGVSVHPDVHVGHAGRPDVPARRPRLAHHDTVVYHWSGAVVRGPSLSIAATLARGQERSAECRCPQLDPVQPRPGARTAALRGHPWYVSQMGIQRAAGDKRGLFPQCDVVLRRHGHADVAACEARPTDAD